MKSRLFFLTGVLFVGLQVGSSTSLEAQQLWEEKIEGAAGQWNINLLRPTGMPVIPFFEGWVLNEDGTANLCFGYFNLNYEEALEIPMGPDNYIEPARYNGLQPTYFGEVPTYDHRHYCAFTVSVPQDGGERVAVLVAARAPGKPSTFPPRTADQGYAEAGPTRPATPSAWTHADRWLGVPDERHRRCRIGQVSGRERSPCRSRSAPAHQPPGSWSSPRRTRLRSSCKRSPPSSAT